MQVFRGCFHQTLIRSIKALPQILTNTYLQYYSMTEFLLFPKMVATPKFDKYWDLSVQTYQLEK